MKTTKQTTTKAENPNYTKCPICRGSGKIEKPKQKIKYFRLQRNDEEIAKILKKHEYSYREIAKLMGYKNAQSIKHLVDK